jgi:RHS repeat-associated protein
MTGGAGRSIAWTSYNKPTGITKGSRTLGFAYDPDHNRTLKTSSLSGNLESTTTYLGKSYERIKKPSGYTEHKHYIAVTGATIVYTQRSNGSNDTRYLHQDHLGSTDVITNEMGDVVEAQSFSAFGARRASNWQDPLVNFVSGVTTRGFTGHEQLDNVGLVHMNGRVYDPQLGRFLSADPYVQFVANPQSLNRYSYVLNNPLSYTDPSGYFSFSKLLGKIHNAASRFLKYTGDPGYHIAHSKPVVNLFLNHQWAQAAGYAAASYFGGPFGAAGFSAYLTEINGGSAADIAKAFALSYLSARVSSYIGDHGGNPIAHGVSQGVISEMGGGSFRSGFWGGFVSASIQINPRLGGDGFAGYATRTLVAAGLGGTAARLGGGKFANGAVSAAFVHMFNAELHHFEGDELVISESDTKKVFKFYFGSEPSFKITDKDRSFAQALAIEGAERSRAVSWIDAIWEGVFGGPIYRRNGVTRILKRLGNKRYYRLHDQPIYDSVRKNIQGIYSNEYRFRSENGDYMGY